MDIGVLTVKGPDYHPNQRLKAAARDKGLSLCLIDPRRISPAIEDGQLSIRGFDNNAMPGVILPRQGSQISNSSLVVLAHLQAMNIPLVNNVQSILAARNKFLTLGILSAAGIKVPTSAFVNSNEEFLSTIDSMGGYPVVCKKTIGRKGREVFLVEGKTQALNIIEKHLLPAEGLLLQQFIPPQGRRDFRVMVIGGKVAAAMEMISPKGDFRSNFSISGKSNRVHLSPEAERMAIKSALAVGLDIAGVDLMISDKSGLVAVETNYAPGFRGLEAATGTDIAAMIIEYATLLKDKQRQDFPGKQCASGT